MQKEFQNRTVHIELSATWQELLGEQRDDTGIPTLSKAPIPMLESDPWSTLLNAKGTEIVDLQKVHLHMDDQDVEQVLQLMQDQSTLYSE